MKPLSLAVGSVIALAATQGYAADLQQIDVVGKKDKNYVVKSASSPKFTQKLVDTPKTINIVNKAVLEDQGVGSLEDALRNISGIATSTLSSGEGGGGKNSLMNNITIRGFDANSSIYTDGIRDLAGYKRDVFNVESVEVAKGANGATQGKGSAGGSVNLVTKKADMRGDAQSVGLSVDEGDTLRVTGDLNKVLDQDSAARINFLLAGGGDYQDNGFEEYKTRAFDLSHLENIDEDTDLTINFSYLEQDNIPVIGVPLVRKGTNLDSDGYGSREENWIGKPARSAAKKYFGTTADFEEVESTKLTAILNHQLNDNWILRSQTRVGVVETESLVSNPRLSGTWKKGTVHPDNRAKNADGSDKKDSRGRFTYKKTGVDPSKDTLDSSSKTYLRDEHGHYLVKYGQDVTNRFKEKSERTQMLVTQFDLLGTEIHTGAVKHDLVVGAEVYREEKKSNSLETGDLKFSPDKWKIDSSGQLKASGHITKNYSSTKTGTGMAVYAIDTVTFSDQWQANAGLRLEDYEIKNKGLYRGKPYSRKYQYDLLSYNASLNYKPLSNGSVYLAYGNNEEPNGTDLNTTRTSSASGYDALGKLEPLESKSQEIGTKWDFFDGRLSLATAWFKTTKDEYDTPDEKEPTTSGEKESKGVELSVAGQLTDEVAAYFTYTNQEAKITKDHDAETGGLTSAPDDTASLWVTHTTGNLILGLGAQHNSGNKYWSGGKVAFDTGKVTLFNAMASYKVSKNLSTQVNVENLTDKFYVTDYAVNNYKAGKPRNLKLSVKYRF